MPIPQRNTRPQNPETIPVMEKKDMFFLLTLYIPKRYKRNVLLIRVIRAHITQHPDKHITIKIYIYIKPT